MISRRVVSYIALAGAGCTIALHILAMLGYTPFEVWTAAALLLLIAFPSWAALIVHANARSVRAGGTRAIPFDWFATIPVWGRRLFVAVLIYAGVNFAAFGIANDGGGLHREADGRYVLSAHGKFIRALDAKGVRAFHAWEVRLLSGHILPFLVLPGLYFLFAPAASESERKPLPPAA